MPTNRRPVVAITCDIIEHNGLERFASPRHYADAVLAAGGLPMLTPVISGSIDINLFDAFVFTGGDDPLTEAFGEPTHPAAERLHSDRQQVELELLRRLQLNAPERPVLGVCLGMQFMALLAGGQLDQHMPDTTPTHADHWEHDHPIEGELAGTVSSRHRQAVSDPGSMRVIARAPDGVIEAIDDPSRPFYVGVQWHPERSQDPAVGRALFRRLIIAARSASTSP